MENKAVKKVNGYKLTFGEFESREKADKEAQKAKEKGYKVKYVVEGEKYKILFAKCRTAAEAKANATAIAKDGFKVITVEY